MKPVVTPAQMAALDRRARDAGTPVDVLIARAGRAVATAVLTELGGAYGRRVAVVSGAGHNGDDGRVAAAVLRDAGVRVAAFDVDRATDPDSFLSVWTRERARADCVVDALTGTGFQGVLEGAMAAVVTDVADAGLPVVAVDIPSGVDGLTGVARGPAFRASQTVTFAALKPGLLFEPGRSRAGTVTVADIGLDVTRAPDAPPDGAALPGEDPTSPLRVGLTDPTDVEAWIPSRRPSDHKWSVGGVFVVGGSGGMTGAPSLVSHAAMRAGAGIVWCGVPGRDAARRASGTEVISVELGAPTADELDADGADAVLRALGRFGVLVLGPGLGRTDETAYAVRRLVAEATVPLVLDADGLNGLAGDVAPLRARVQAGRAGTILTPHEGEYARLMGVPVGDDRLAAAYRLAADSGAVVLLKGPGTVVADPSGRCAITPGGGPWLATAGAGDVLAGIVGAFVSRGAPPFEAAAAAALVHARAGDVAGHEGLIASDLIAALPAATRDPGPTPHEEP